MVGTNLKKKNSYKFYGKRVPKSFYFIFSDNTECSVDFKNAFFIPKMLQTFLDMKVQWRARNFAHQFVCH
jgi:hypothetical protein